MNASLHNECPCNVSLSDECKWPRLDSSHIRRCQGEEKKIFWEMDILETKFREYRKLLNRPIFCQLISSQLSFNFLTWKPSQMPAKSSFFPRIPVKIVRFDVCTIQYCAACSGRNYFECITHGASVWNDSQKLRSQNFLSAANL